MTYLFEVSTQIAINARVSLSVPKKDVVILSAYFIEIFEG